MEPLPNRLMRDHAYEILNDSDVPLNGSMILTKLQGLYIFNVEEPADWVAKLNRAMSTNPEMFTRMGRGYYQLNEKKGL